MQRSVTIKVPPTTNLSYDFNTKLISSINNCNVKIEINANQNRNYSKILSAGHVISPKSKNVTSFVDFSLPDVYQIAPTGLIALTKQGHVYERYGYEYEWRKIEGFPSAVKQVAHYFKYVLLDDGQVFSCQINYNSCTLQPILKDIQAKKILTSMNATYILCYNNELYAFGNNFTGQLVYLVAIH